MQTSHALADIKKVKANDGVSIAFQTAGSGSRTVLAVHGWGGAGSGHSWREVIKHLDLTDVKFAAIDLRGHGESGQPDGGFTLEQFGHDILAVAEDIGADKFVLVGYSMGGRWSQWISCAFPQRVLGQILIAPAPAGALPLGKELLDSWIHETSDRESFEIWLRQFTCEPLSDEVIDGYFRDLSRASNIAKTETFWMCVRDDFRYRLVGTQASTLIIAGEHDPIFSPDFLRQEIASLLPRARLVRVDCGHEIPVEKPAQAAALIEAFLTALPE